MSSLKLEKRISQAKEHLYQNENIKAMELFKEILYEYPLNEEAWLYLGVIRHRAGEYNAAIECYRKATELNNLLLEAWGLLTVAYIDQGKRSEAVKIIEKAEKLNPSEEKLNFLRGNLDQMYLTYKSFLNRINT